MLHETFCFPCFPPHRFFPHIFFSAVAGQTIGKQIKFQKKKNVGESRTYSFPKFLNNMEKTGNISEKYGPALIAARQRSKGLDAEIVVVCTKSSLHVHVFAMILYRQDDRAPSWWQETI